MPDLTAKLSQAPTSATPAETEHEQLAVIHDAHLGYDRGPSLVFSTFIDEHSAADQWLPLQVSRRDYIARSAPSNDDFILSTPATDMLDAYHPRQISDLNGRPVWVTVDAARTTIRYLRPYIRKELRG